MLQRATAAVIARSFFQCIVLNGIKDNVIAQHCKMQMACFIHLQATQVRLLKSPDVSTKKEVSEALLNAQRSMASSGACKTQLHFGVLRRVHKRVDSCRERLLRHHEASQ